MREKQVAERSLRVYIAGPMSGYHNYNREAFWRAAKEITEKTCLVPVHTAWIELGYDYRVYMGLSFDLLAACDLIVTLPGWQHSDGAKQEMRYAEQRKIPHVEMDQLARQYPKQEN